MAIRYVNSAAAGTNDGTSWTDAWTSLGSSTGVAAGDEVRVHNAHSEDPGATVNYNWTNGTAANPVKIVCVNKDASDALSTGATIAQTVISRAITLTGYIYVDGLAFNASDTVTLVGVSQIYVNCTFGIVVTTNSRNLTFNAHAALYELRKCTINVTQNTGATVALGVSSHVSLIDCTVNYHASATTAFSVSSEGAKLELRSCNIGAATTMFVTTTRRARIVVSRCKLGTHTNLFGTFTATNFAASIVVEESVVGTVTGPTKGLIGYAGGRGVVLGDTGRYRTGGASRNGTGFSWEMAPNTLASAHGALFTPDFAKKVTGGSAVTITAYVAGGAEMYNDEVWLELEGPDDSNTSQGYYYSSKMPWRGTQAALTTDGSTWNGTGVGTVRKITHTYTPNHSGLLVARIAYGKTSGAAIYVDPQMAVA